MSESNYQNNTSPQISEAPHSDSKSTDILPSALIDAVLSLGHDIWTNLAEYEREKADWSSPFAERLKARVLGAYPHRSICEDIRLYRLLQSAANFCEEYNDEIANLTLNYAAWILQRRAFGSEAVDDDDALARLSLLIGEIEEGGSGGNKEDLIATLQMVRNDLRARIHGPSFAIAAD